MIIDKHLEFSVAQALTASGASTNVIDFKQGHRAPGKGQPLFLVVQLKADADGANGNETYAVTLQTDSAENFSGVVDVVEVPIPRGTKAGKRYVVSVPHNTDRFLRVNYTLGGTTPALTVDAFLTDQEPTSWAAMPDAVN